MDEREALFQAILAAPDDDTPRLVYADWLEEHGDHDRAEFIRVQVELARLRADEAERAREAERFARLSSREAQLLAQHADGWRQELPSPERWGAWGRFERGFVEWLVAGEWEAFAVEAEWVLRATPGRSLQILEGNPQFVTVLAASPILGQLRRLDLTGCQLEDAEALTLAVSPHVANLQSLNLRGNLVNDAGVRALADSPRLASLRELDLSDNLLGNPSVQALVSSGLLRRLEVLRLSGNRDVDDRAARRLVEAARSEQHRVAVELEESVAAPSAPRPFMHSPSPSSAPAWRNNGGRVQVAPEPELFRRRGCLALLWTAIVLALLVLLSWAIAQLPLAVGAADRYFGVVGFVFLGVSLILSGLTLLVPAFALLAVLDPHLAPLSRSRWRPVFGFVLAGTTGALLGAVAGERSAFLGAAAALLGTASAAVIALRERFNPVCPRLAGLGEEQAGELFVLGADVNATIAIAAVLMTLLPAIFQSFPEFLPVGAMLVGGWFLCMFAGIPGLLALYPFAVAAMPSRYPQTQVNSICFLLDVCSALHGAITALFAATGCYLALNRSLGWDNAVALARGPGIWGQPEVLACALGGCFGGMIGARIGWGSIPQEYQRAGEVWAAWRRRNGAGWLAVGVLLATLGGLLAWAFQHTPKPLP